MKKTLLVILLFLVAVTGVNAQVPATFSLHLQYMLDSLCKKYHIKGASAAVNIPGMGIWKGASGVSYDAVPITTDMYLPIGSNTKTFCAATILKLQENGQLDINDTIGKWLTNIPNVSGQITLKQLLNHTSGLFSYTDNAAFFTALNADYTKTWQPEDMLQWINAPNFAPGTSWAYSNTNFLLAGLIIKKILNQPFATSVRSIILTPQSLNSTVTFPAEQPSGTVPHAWSVAASATNKLEDMQVTYNWENTAFQSMAGSAGAMMSTAEDNVKFWDALMTGKIINFNSLTQMTTCVSIGSGAGYGLGIFRYNSINGHAGYCHGGTCFGYINENFRDSVNGISITVLSNQDSIDNNKLFNYVVVPMHKYLLGMPPTAIKEVTTDYNITVYPIPATDHISVDIAKPGSDVKAQLMDITGKTISVTQLISEHNNIATDNIPAGLYIARITNGSGLNYVQKVQVIK